MDGMNKLSKKQLIALYVLTAIIFICLIGAFVVLRKDSRKLDTIETTKTTQQQAGDTEDTGSLKEAGNMSVNDMISELTPMLGLTTTSSLDAEKIAYYYEVKEEDMEECGGVIGDVALADELVIMKARDEAGAAKLEKGARKRLESQKSSFQDYIPEQYKRLNDAQIVTADNYVLFVCCDNVDGVVSKFQSFIEQ